jgi:glucose/arabinose dehydrogenase
MRKQLFNSMMALSLMVGFVAGGFTACGLETANPQQDAPQAQPASAAPAQPSQPSHDSIEAAAQSRALPSVHLVNAFPNLSFQRPIFITHAPTKPDAAEPDNRLFVVEQAGRILIVENSNDASETRTFLDIRPKVRMRHNEEGLLSLVFHPKFNENGQFFVYHSVSNPKRNRIARYNVMSADASQADPESELVILDVEQKYGNHNGSTLLFGRDGFLYASFGDGGLANDPDLNGQNLSTLLAKIIRIDVDRPENGKPYAIPSDNPFVNRNGAAPEIWAYGLRNIWRMSFDSKTGDLWAADVGQDRWEEIDLIVKGGNYGWAFREGKHDFGPGIKRAGAVNPPDPMIDPVIDYSHREGISVTGGYVYRGKKYPRLVGAYIYADYATRIIWGLRYSNGEIVAHRQLTAATESTFITSFGEGVDGELFACAFDQPDGRAGKIYRVVAE